MMTKEVINIHEINVIFSTQTMYSIVDILVFLMNFACRLVV